MWFAVIGAVLIIGAVLGPRFGVTFYSSGRPGGKGQTDNSLNARIATGVIGGILILFGLKEYLFAGMLLIH
jgi:hypothetical protein